MYFFKITVCPVPIIVFHISWDMKEVAQENILLVISCLVGSQNLRIQFTLTSCNLQAFKRRWHCSTKYVFTQSFAGIVPLIVLFIQKAK